MAGVNLSGPDPGTAHLDDAWVPTTCDMCWCACTIRAHRVGGVVVKTEGIPEAPPNHGKMCAKGNAAVLQLYSPNRITRPLLRRNRQKGRGVDPEWQPIDWDEALAILERQLRRVMDEDPRKLIAASFDTYSYAPVRAFLTAVGSPNLTAGPAGYFCGNGIHPITYVMTGSIEMHPDIRYANLMIMFGAARGFVANTNVMPTTREMARARTRGMKLIVVDPQLSNAAAQATEWVPIRPGTDAALALGMANVLVNELGIYDRDFLRRYSNGPYLVGDDGRYVRHPSSHKPLVWDTARDQAAEYDAVPWQDAALAGAYRTAAGPCRPAFACLADSLQTYTPERVAERTTVPAAKVRDLAEQFGAAAQIGSTIVIDGVELPHRPASVSWFRGATAHKHAWHFGLALALLNALVGAVDVPGGVINANGAGPFGFPSAGSDGLLVPGNWRTHMKPPYPPRQVRPPETAELVELFPVSVYARAMLWLGVLEPERFGLPYQPDTLIVCRTNLMANTGDPAVMGAALEKMRFIAAFADHHNETTEYADLVLPDTNFLERLVPLCSNPYGHARTVPLSGGQWTFNLQQPVVPPRGESRYWPMVLWEVAGRLGLMPDVYAAFNASAHLEGEYCLDPGGSYTWEECCDRWVRSWLGAEHGLAELRQRGYHVTAPRSVRDTYPRPFHDGRLPVYMEYFLDMGRRVQAVTRELGITDWDVSDYRPLPEFKPCPAGDRSRHPDYDLYVINYKLPYLTFSFTIENPLLMELAQQSGRAFPVSLHPKTARRRGLRAGDAVWLETPEGQRARGVVRLTEGLHPECVGVASVLGRWVTSDPAVRGQGVHFNSLIHYTFDRLDTLSAALDSCVRVKLTRA